MAERRGIDERHLRERRPARAAPQAGSRRPDPDRRHGSEVRQMSLGRTVALTDTGRKRRHNEDVYVVDPPIFAIADGMGGAKAGEVAAALAADVLRGEGGSGEEALVTLIQEGNRRVYERASEDAAKSGMGTTMTVALLEDGHVRIGHIGYSRAYLIRDCELSQLTDDHSLVGELVRSGKLAPELVERNRRDLDAAAKALVAAANKGGGDDNITVVAFEIASPDEETAEDARPREPVLDDEEDTLTELDEVPTVKP